MIGGLIMAVDKLGKLVWNLKTLVASTHHFSWGATVALTEWDFDPNGAIVAGLYTWTPL
jgi:hypothetical protein